MSAEVLVPLHKLVVGLLADGTIAHVVEVCGNTLAVEHGFDQVVKVLP